MGSQIPDEGKAGPQSQLNDAWMIKSQKGERVDHNISERKEGCMDASY